METPQTPAKVRERPPSPLTATRYRSTTDAPEDSCEFGIIGTREQIEAAIRLQAGARAHAAAAERARRSRRAQLQARTEARLTAHSRLSSPSANSADEFADGPVDMAAVDLALERIFAEAEAESGARDAVEMAGRDAAFVAGLFEGRGEAGAAGARSASAGAFALSLRSLTLAKLTSTARGVARTMSDHSDVLLYALVGVALLAARLADALTQEGGPPAWMLPFLPARYHRTAELTGPVDLGFLDDYEMGGYARASAPAAVAVGAVLDLVRYAHIF